MRVCAVQMAHGTQLADNLARAAAHVARAAQGGARLALLPEYFFSTFQGPPVALVEAAPQVRAMMQDASRAHGIAVGGNVIEGAGTPGNEGAKNVGVVYERGALVLSQPKVHPMPREAASGVVGGAGFGAATVEGRRAGMLVCADILYPEAARVLALAGADILLNPVMSPWKEKDDGREARVAMYVARAYDSGAFVVKAAGFRRPTPGAAPPFGIAGRSLITAPWGVLARARDDFEDELLFADLDFERLATFRAGQAQFPPRRPDAYGDLVRP